MPDIKDPVDRLSRDIRARHPDRDLDIKAFPVSEEEDDEDFVLEDADTQDSDDARSNGDWWLTVEDEDGREVVGVDIKPRQHSFGVTRPNDDGSYPKVPDRMFEGEDAYDDALEEIDGVLSNPDAPQPKQRRP